jgi:hypothetical protein
MLGLDRVFKGAADRTVIPVDPDAYYTDGYYGSVAARSFDATGETIYGQHPACLAIFDQILFMRAKDRVSILSEVLDERIYGKPDTICAAVIFLKSPGARLDILVERDVDLDEHPMMLAFQREGVLSRVTVGRVPDNQQNYLFNFIVTDGPGYRFQGLRQETNSRGAFGDTSMAKLMQTRFDSIKSRAVPVKPLRGAGEVRAFTAAGPADGSQGPN